MTQDGMLNIFASTINNHDNTSIGASVANQYTFNPIEKIVELYERILQTEKEKNDLLLKLMEGKH